MDKSIKISLSHNAPPVIALANWFQFGASERIISPWVESRMFLWCVQGRGRVRVNDLWIDMRSDDWVLLPWAHETHYEADSRTPFLVGAVHMIPAHDTTVPVEFRIAHTKTDPLAGKAYRRDSQWPALDGIRGCFSSEDSLRTLATYIVECFGRKPVEETLMRNLAGLLRDELFLRAANSPRGDLTVPVAFRQMREYIRDHLSQQISVDDLARLADVSHATTNRLFRRYTGHGPREWIAGVRLAEAERMLHTTNATVRKIGEQVGFEDPFHFSRFFRRRAGVAPTEYRRRRKLL